MEYMYILQGTQYGYRQHARYAAGSNPRAEAMHRRSRQDPVELFRRRRYLASLSQGQCRLVHVHLSIHKCNMCM